MPFLLRRVLEESQRLEEAVELVRAGPRTGGYNYLFGEAATGRAVALETTHGRFASFWIGQEPPAPHVLRVPDAIFRSDWAVDPAVREVQSASRGNPARPGLEPPEGSKAYDVRYRGQALLLERFHGRIDPETAMAIASAVAPSSNIQSIVYATPQLWIAVARGRTAAAQGGYVGVDLEELFSR